MNSKKINKYATGKVLQAPSKAEDSIDGDFLWVNETSKDAAIRTKIRSHVGKDRGRKLKGNDTTNRTHYAALRSKDVIGNHPTPSNRGEVAGCNSSTSFTESTLIETICTENGDSQRITQTYHRRKYNTEPARNVLRKEGSLVNKGCFQEAPFSPIEVLGAGRVDPFSCYFVSNPKHYVHEFIDHSIHYILPGFVPDDDSPHPTSHSTSKFWFNLALAHPLLFHAFVYSGAVHRDFLRWTTIFPNSPAALPHKIFVIRKLNEILADPKQACGNEVLTSVLVLASHETMSTPEGERNPFDSPLKNTQWINVYGHIRYAPEHIKALLSLVALRGGMEKIDMPGLAEIIVFGDVVSATNTVSKPVHKPLRSTKPRLTALQAWATSPPRPSIQTQAAGFKRLEFVGLTSEMLEVFKIIGALTLGIDYYLRGELIGLKLGSLARVRTPIQQMLLSLPNAGELKQSDTNRPIMYECCRTAALIYGIAVVFPVPNSFSVLQELVKSLRTSLEASENESCEMVDLELLLWILVLGGIAALDKPERPWFVSQLASLLETDASNLLAWASVEVVLEGFLWLDSACGSGGRLLWSEVLESYACDGVKI